MSSDYVLAHGTHASPQDGRCAMEWVSYLAGEPHTDEPVCVSPVLRAMCIALNDGLDLAPRQRLRSYLTRTIGTAHDGLDEQRGWMAMDWLTRVYTPAWLHLGGLREPADALITLPAITDGRGLRHALPLLEAARREARGARARAFGIALPTGWAAAVAGREAAWSCAGAAAWAAARLGVGDIAGDRARAAARAGAGYVTVAAPANVANVLRAHLIEQVVVEIPSDASPDAVVDALLETAQRNSSVAIGPGLGLDDRTAAIVVEFLRRSRLPAVADASALFHLAKHLDVLRGKPAVLTPHAGEFARLSGKGTVRPGDRVARLREFVERTGVATLLKGRDTLIDDGNTMHLNSTGTNALATAGSGDVLTGIVATLAARGLGIVDAARAGAYWHGLAGQRAADLRPIGVTAGDLIDALADALPSMDSRDPKPAGETRTQRAAWRLF